MGTELDTMCVWMYLRPMYKSIISVASGSGHPCAYSVTREREN